MLPRCQCRSFVTVEEAGPHLAGADVILCDLMMPDRSALALYDGADDELRARIVFVTGGAYSQWARELLVRARNPALDKPIDRTALRQAVSRVAAARD
jgi:CheY-like chemotaxis protein